MGSRRNFIKTSAGVGADAALGVCPKSLRGAPVGGDSRHEDSAYLFESA